MPPVSPGRQRFAESFLHYVQRGTDKAPGLCGGVMVDSMPCLGLVLGQSRVACQARNFLVVTHGDCVAWAAPSGRNLASSTVHQLAARETSWIRWSSGRCCSIASSWHTGHSSSGARGLRLVRCLGLSTCAWPFAVLPCKLRQNTSGKQRHRKIGPSREISIRYRPYRSRF